MMHRPRNAGLMNLSIVLEVSGDNKCAANGGAQVVHDDGSGSCKFGIIEGC